MTDKILTHEDIRDINNEIEKKVGELKEKKDGSERLWARQILDAIPGEQVIKNAWKKYRLKYSTDKWNQKEKKCGDGACGLKPHDKNYLWFSSEECKNSYCKFLKKFKEGEQAYQVLIDDSTPSSNEWNRKEKCDYCQKIFPWNTRHREFKSLAKGFGRDKEESFWFCSSNCYKNFLVCYFCGRKSQWGENVGIGSGWVRKKSTGYTFCPDHRQEVNQSTNSSNNQQKCYQCGRESYRKNEQGQTIFLYPSEDEDKLFCSSECIEKWRKIINSQKNIGLLRSEAIADILDFLSLEPEVKTEDLEPKNRNWTAAINNADTEEDINAIKLAALEDIRKKRTSKSGKNRIRTLLELAKTKNDFEELFSIIKQLKELRFIEGYKEYQEQIEEQEARLKNINPQEYSKRIKGSFEEQIKNNGLSYEELSTETKAAMEEAKNTGEPEKVKIAEELIDTDSSIKKLNQLLAQIGQVQTKSEKKDLLNELLIFIEENISNRRAYEKKRSEIDEVINSLIRETRNNLNPSKDFPYLPIFLTLIVIFMVGVSGFLIWKRKRRISW